MCLRKFLPGDTAIMVPQTEDGRVLFAVPWHDKVVLGTTDTPVDKPSLELMALEEEIEFVIKHALLPIPTKGGSDWAYSWIPVAAPLTGAALAYGLFLLLS